MLGLCGMLVAYLAVVRLVSYRISWDTQPKQARTSFAPKSWNDFMDFAGKCRGIFRIGEWRWRAALDGHAKQKPANSTH